jgi:hypothetical protein
MKYRYKILVLPFKDHIHDGVQLGAWDTLESVEFYKSKPCDQHDPKWVEAHCNWKTFGEGVWIPALGMRFAKNEVEDLLVPFDKFDKEILIGDLVAYAMRDLTVSRMRVDKIAKGCIYGFDIDLQKRNKNGSPYKCINLDAYTRQA